MESAEELWSGHAPQLRSGTPQPGSVARFSRSRARECRAVLGRLRACKREDRELSALSADNSKQGRRISRS
jgi:hypothetical protein